MDPVIGAAAIMAATQVIGGLLGQSAAKEQAKKQMISSALQQQTSLEQAAIQQAAQSQQGALANVIEAYKQSLLG
jgi:hypothetical protein